MYRSAQVTVVTTSVSVRALVSSFTTGYHDKWKNLNTLSRSPNTCAELHRSRQTQRGNRPVKVTTVCAAAMVGFTVHQEVWCHMQSSDWWEHVIVKTSDDERWRTNVTIFRRTFVRICGHLAPRLVHHDTPFRWSISVKWCKSTLWYLIWTSRVSGMKTHLYKLDSKAPPNVVWIKCAKIRFHVIFCCSDYQKWVQTQSGWTKNLIFGWQSEQTLRKMSWANFFFTSP